MLSDKERTWELSLRLFYRIKSSLLILLATKNNSIKFVMFTEHILRERHLDYYKYLLWKDLILHPTSFCLSE
jgi:hypothetical protein